MTYTSIGIIQISHDALRMGNGKTSLKFLCLFSVQSQVPVACNVDDNTFSVRIANLLRFF